MNLNTGLPPWFILPHNTWLWVTGGDDGFLRIYIGLDPRAFRYYLQKQADWWERA